ncbi:MAG: phenylalanine--tRNA ligase subunit beta [Treponema sp.]|nr:phenylalanine--tRNA ligase subunit beta [Treponema sp.]MCL2271839.1 phenylalanine--tRNA ligase subunit beta [Treponema sp.]
MPKIEVNEQVFYTLAARPGGWKNRDEFEAILTCAKAELDEDSDKSLPEQERTLKIELNDTNRPDLWGTAGCARQLKIYNSGKIPEYSFFSRQGSDKKTTRKVKVEASVKQVRPYIAGFIAKGKTITDPMLRDMIQTQEKLAWNFGRKRRAISMGLYRIALIKWPIIYKGADPDSVSFIPLQTDQPFGPLTLREILRQHPKGREYAFILEKEPVHPLLTDSQGFILSYPPIINSNDLGAVEVGDSEIFVELTGTDMHTLTLAASIVACDFADNGFTIEPVEMEYEYDTLFGRNPVFPRYFQEPIFCSLSRVEKFLGEKLNADECVQALMRMGVKAEKTTDMERGTEVMSEGVRAYPPEYRNDFLHAADIIEDIMIGRSLGSFKSQRPSDATIGRLLPITLFSRQVKEALIGLGYQEMIYNYLGSRKDLVEKMRGDGGRIIRIFNPMTENYEYVRDSVIASLMASESVSGRSVYPHKIFETGKIAYLDDNENYRSSTCQYAGFLHAGTDSNFNTAAAELQTLFYYLSREYKVEESSDPRFIPGRAAAIIYKGKSIGVFGELHPETLENWGVTVPCTACEIDLDALIL